MDGSDTGVLVSALACSNQQVDQTAERGLPQHATQAGDRGRGAAESGCGLRDGHASARFQKVDSEGSAARRSACARGLDAREGVGIVVRQDEPGDAGYELRCLCVADLARQCSPGPTTHEQVVRADDDRLCCVPTVVFDGFGGERHAPSQGLVARADEPGVHLRGVVLATHEGRLRRTQAFPPGCCHGASCVSLVLTLIRLWRADPHPLSSAILIPRRGMRGHALVCSAVRAYHEHGTHCCGPGVRPGTGRRCGPSWSSLR